MLEVTCKWDSDGELGRYRADDHQEGLTPDGTPGSFFGDFVFTADTGDRAAGRISAFASCYREVAASRKSNGNPGAIRPRGSSLYAVETGETLRGGEYPVPPDQDVRLNS